MASSYATVLSTIAVIVAVLSALTPTESRLTDHQRMLLQGGSMNGKRSQPDLRPHYLNMMDNDVDTEELETEREQSPLAWYIAHLSPAKRHMLSQLLEMTRVNDELNQE